MNRIYRIARTFINVRREQQIRTLMSHFIRVRCRSSAVNVYHCCVWKTASQWLRNVFSSADVYRYSGLLTYPYEQVEGRDDRALQDRTFERPFPERRIVTPLYINFDSFAAMPKPREFRAFFVARDPRDLVVSHYFSSRYSHVQNPGVLEERARLEGISESEGMAVHARYMAERGIFAALRSWAEHCATDERVALFRFEDLVGTSQADWMTQLFSHCDIRIPHDALASILARLSFARLSGGRKPGEEDKHHKYRSGKHGDWQRYFDDTVSNAFAEVAGDLPRMLGYE